MTLPHVATSYQPKENVETTLKCLLGERDRERETERQRETERDRERQTERHRETERQREIERGMLSLFYSIIGIL